jgi:hypothetical protein
MAVTLNASTSSGFIQTADTSGQLVIQSNGTTELTVLSTGVTVADNLLFNSGYGSAVIGYGCRAWVNFNGTGTVAIRGSGNVTSITDNGTGLYTVNFTTSMPDVNYGALIAGRRATTDDGWCRTEVFNTGSLQVVTGGTTSNSKVDWEVVSVAIFR